MIPQQYDGFYVLERDSFNGKIHPTGYYPTLESFFQGHCETYIKEFFRTTLNDRITYIDDSFYYNRYSKILVNEKDEIYTVDRIIGLYRKWILTRPTWAEIYNKRHSNGRKKRAHKRFRRIKTFQERKWCHGWDDEDFAPKARAGRNDIPDPWDDIYGHNDKNWKTQSKRKKQWKPVK